MSTISEAPSICNAIFRNTGQRCNANAVQGKSKCARHGGLSTGPRTPEGRKRCADARTTHGRETTSMRLDRALASARLAVLEEIGFAVGMLNGSRTRGRKPLRMGEVYVELQNVTSMLMSYAPLKNYDENC